MRVVIDMVATITIVPVALGAVAEFEIRVFGIGAAADRALMPVGLLTGFGMIPACPVGIGLGVGLSLLRTAVAHRGRQ